MESPDQGLAQTQKRKTQEKTYTKLQLMFSGKTRTEKKSAETYSEGGPVQAEAEVSGIREPETEETRTLLGPGSATTTTTTPSVDVVQVAPGDLARAHSESEGESTIKLSHGPLPITPVSTTVKDAKIQEAQQRPLNVEESETMRLPFSSPIAASQTMRLSSIPASPAKGMSRAKACLSIVLLCIVLLQAISAGSPQLFGSHGWASVLSGGTNSANSKLLHDAGKQLQKQATARGSATTTPQQYIDTIISKMTLEQKLGQMMVVQFNGPLYSPDLNDMITQYNVGSVLIFKSNGNIDTRSQLSGLTQQMQQHSNIPLIIATDQEGGTVDRLVDLDGPRPAAADIGQASDPVRAASQAGKQDASDLASYGINLNLAPVVDVDTQNAAEIHYDARAFGRDPATVTRLAGAYLSGLQQSNKVFGTLKHFPGLGAIPGDVHTILPTQPHTKAQLEQLDWAPYISLIQQKQVHAIMVTHEILADIDTKPASLSQKVIQGILRDEMGYQGVIMTDSLNMQGLALYTSEDQAAVLAIEAGSDMIMGPSSPTQIGSYIDTIKGAINMGQISQQRIDQSMRRILQMKYDLGLLTLPKS